MQIVMIVGVLLAEVVMMLGRLRMDWLGIVSSLTHLATLVVTFMLLRKYTKSGTARWGFREVVITVGLMFGAIASNIALHYTQLRIFGQTYVASGMQDGQYESTVSKEQPKVFTVAERVAHTLADVASEEIIFRGIVLGGLLLVTTPIGAVLISSLAFATIHTVYPLAAGQTAVALSKLLPMLALGLFFGVVYVRSGLIPAIVVHFVANLIGVFTRDHTYIADTIIFGSAAVTLIILPITLWFSRRRAMPALTAK